MSVPPFSPWPTVLCPAPLRARSARACPPHSPHSCPSGSPFFLSLAHRPLPRSAPHTLRSTPESGCSTSSCPTGADNWGTDTGYWKCFTGWFIYNCYQNFQVGNSQCAGCKSDRYGSNCNSCNCGSGGTCRSGIASDGYCKCTAGFTGSGCTNGQFKSGCVCNQCTGDYVKSGTKCLGPCPGGDCGTGGTCVVSGSTYDCSCSTGWAETADGICSVCAAGYYLKLGSSTYD